MSVDNLVGAATGTFVFRFQSEATARYYPRAGVGQIRDLMESLL